jgi:divinyl protochlorophyllide a 8-vinyl-reductase
LRIRSNPLCRGLVADVPSCDFYTATFQSLFTALVHPNAQVTEVACEARGDPECRFEISW